jgi:sugar O-acyltransferase (sialic acid O-acetyltransferase NeuD family)
MPIREISIFGTGGHGKVVLDALQAATFPTAAILLFDDDARLAGSLLLGITIRHSKDRMNWEGSHVHLAVGSNNARARLAIRFATLGTKLTSVIHPRASLAASSIVGAGCFVAAQAVLGPSTVLGPGVIVNHGAAVDHDCTIGAFAHIAPNATLGGKVVIGKGVLVGAGANILPGVTIADGAVIGAGAVVRKDVAEGDIYAGVPARSLRKA